MSRTAMDFMPTREDGWGMILLAVILFIVGIVLLFLGVFVAAAKFLLWVGIVIAIIAIIIGLLRFIRRNV
jgi:hypothetical protein